MQLRARSLLAPIVAIATGASIETSHADDQTVPGAGNAAAAATAAGSPRVLQAERFLAEQARRIRDRSIRTHTLDILSARVCVRHRRALATAAAKDAVVQRLLAAGLLSAEDGAAIPGGLRTGVFPPVLHEGTICPQLPQPFRSAPGSVFGGHHSYPGGLAVHEANNDRIDVALAEQYRQSYGMPTEVGEAAAGQRFLIDDDLIIAAPIWHDWAKAIVFQWNGDGTEFVELSFGGNGRTDNFGQPGDSRTPGHHILGLAEAMVRGLPPALVITQASAHAAPVLGNEFQVVNWLRAAAMIANLDPVTTGYLMSDRSGRLRLPALRQLGDFDLPAAGQTNLLAEYSLHSLSDSDNIYATPAVAQIEVLLTAVAPRFGFDPADATRFNTRYRNVVLSHLSPERLLILYSSGGLDAIEDEVDLLRRRGAL